MKYNKVHIIQDGNSTEVFVDEVKVQGLLSVEFSASRDDIPTVSIEFVTTSVDVEIEEVQGESTGKYPRL